MALPEYRRARRVLWYVSHGDELPTHDAIRQELARGRTVLVPYVDGLNLRIWRIDALEELRPGAFGILEPPPTLRGDSGREPPPQRVDFVVVPGVAFDPRGGRLGSGQGFYDRLLGELRPDCTRAGLCYETQIIDRVPAEPHDQPMDLVVTDRRVRRRR